MNHPTKFLTWYKNFVSAGDPGVVPGSCQNRKQSKSLKSRSASLFLQNYFTTYPVESEACRENSAPLAAMVGTCYKAAGNLMPNYVAVNFYMVLLNSIVHFFFLIFF